MSERGSVCSEYFYCVKCAKATEIVFQAFYGYTTSVVVVDQGGEPYPIIVVAKSRCGYSGEEIHFFGGDVAEALSAVLCHSVRFAIIADSEEYHGIARVAPGVPYATWLESSQVGDA